MTVASFARAARYTRKAKSKEPSVNAASTCSSAFPVLRAYIKSMIIEFDNRTLSKHIDTGISLSLPNS